jgi:hypothetical protein
MKSVRAKAFALGILATSPAAAGDELGISGWQGPVPSASDLAVYIRCSDVAAERLLSFEEAQICGLTFLRIKLSFLPDVDIERYRGMSAAQKAEANRRGYAAYRAWLAASSVLAAR